MKQHELSFSIIKIPIDFCTVWIAFFIAKEIRLITDLIPWVYLPIQTIDSSSLNIFAIWWALLYISIFFIHKLYNLQMTHSKIQEILDVLRYGVYWFVFFSMGIYFWNGIIYSWSEIPRLIILFTMIIAIFGSIFSRIILNIIHSYLLKYNIISKRRLLLISSDGEKSMKNILDDIKSSQVYTIIWYANLHKQSKTKIPYIWATNEIEELCSARKCDEILYIWSDFSKSELYKIWEISRIYWVRYRYITNNFDVTKTNTSLSLINRTPVIEIKNTPLENWWRIWKRIFDVSISLWLLVLLSPLWLLIIILIKIEDPSWPAIYKNRRIGQNGHVFNCYKFRYLKWKHCIKESYGVKNTEDPAIDLEKKLIEKNNSRSGPLYKIKKDPRKTKIGNILEKYSFDELPNFINVLKWEMSIVWPRPHQPREVAQYKKYQNRLLTVKPWVTWMAQVNGRENNNFELEAKLDIFYIENWSFLLDLKIMFKTFIIIFTRK